LARRRSDCGRKRHQYAILVPASGVLLGASVAGIGDEAQGRDLPVPDQLRHREQSRHVLDQLPTAKLRRAEGETRNFCWPGSVVARRSLANSETWLSTTTRRVGPFQHVAVADDADRAGRRTWLAHPAPIARRP
jgi:hypothetical protein